MTNQKKVYVGGSLFYNNTRRKKENSLRRDSLFRFNHGGAGVGGGEVALLLST